MASTYHLYQQYGKISPTESGTVLFGKCKYYPAPIIQEATTNNIFVYDATSDYATYSVTGMVGYYDSYFGMRGVGSARYYLDGSSPTPNIKLPSSNYHDSGVNSYKTASLYVWSEHALQVRLDLNLQDSSGTAVGGTDSTTVTLTPNKWNRIQVISSTNGQRYLATLNILSFNSATDTGKTFYIDSVQVENKRYATSYHNSSSRLASQLDYTIPRIGPDYTVTCWAKIGNSASAANAGTTPFFTLYSGSTDYAVVQYVEGTTKVQAFKDDTDPNTDFSTANFDLNPGDLVFVALVNDGLTLKVYVGKDGGSLISADSTTDFGTFDTIILGRNPVASTYLNGPIENVILHKKALTQSEIETIFTSASPIEYASSQEILLQTGGIDLIGSVQAMSRTGLGKYRSKSSTVSLDIQTASAMSTRSEFSSSLATHIVYGEDVEKLELNGYMATSTDLTLASMYKVNSIMDTLIAGKTAFVYKM